MNKEDKLDQIAERVYNASFILVTIVVLSATAGNMLASYLLGANIVLVPDNVFKFIEHVLYIFAVPLSLKIANKSLPYIAEIILAWKGISPSSNVETGNFGVEANNDPH